MALSRRAAVTALAAVALGAGLVAAPAASAETAQTASSRCWLMCSTPTTAPTVAPAPLPVTAPVVVVTPVPVPVDVPAVITTKPPRPQLTGGEVAELLSLINRHRRSIGVGAVSLDPALTDIARAHTATMIRLSLLHHNDSLFTRATHQRLGIKLFAENVGYGSGVSDNNDGFLNSPHHRENMEGAAYTLVGLAVGRSSDGRIWVTEDFGTPRAGGTTVAPRPAPRAATASRTTSTAPRRTSTAPRTVTKPAPAAPKAKPGAPRVVAAAPGIAQLAAHAPTAVAPVIDAAAAAVPADLSFTESAHSSAAPIGAGVAAGLAGLAFLVIAPRRRKAVASR